MRPRTAWALAACLATACGASQATRRGPGAAIASDDVDATVLTTAESDGGRGASDGGAGPGIAVSADAGIRSSEIAWLVAHLADEPDQTHGADSGNVRALAAYGADGVRAALHVLRHGDATRARFARRVLERVMLGACRRHPRADAQQLALWFELGGTPPGGVNDAGIIEWSRADDQMWPDVATARVAAWLDAGTPCASVPVARDAGAAAAGGAS